MENTRHPTDPPSNVAKFGGTDPEKYTLDKVSMTVVTDESLTPGRPPCLTQQSVAKFLQPLTRELVLEPPRPTVDELPESVKHQMVLKDKAFWVDKPGANAYTLHDAYYNCGMTSELVRPPHQDVFPRSYQYDLDCVQYRRQHACDALKQQEGDTKKPVKAQCRDCQKMHIPGLTPFQLAWAKDPGQKRWKDYPDLTANLTSKQIRDIMDEYVYLMVPPHCCEYFGRPFQNEACNWYYKNYPPVKYNCIVRKFSK